MLKIRPSVQRLTLALSLLVAMTAPAVQADMLIYQPSDEILQNPERGIFRWGELVESTDFQVLRDQGFSLCYGKLRLDPFRESEISEERLAEIGDAFDRMREAGLKCWVRVSYNQRIGDEDASLQWVERHLEQLGPVFERHRDVIAWFEMGIIGPWGEGHSSTHDLETPEARRAVLDLLIEHVPEDKFINARTPQQKDAIFEGRVMTEEDAFSGEPIARVGHFNDCWLASVTDMGTYPEDELHRWRARVAHDTLWVPLGGETCGRGGSFTATGFFALAELAQMRWTYLHRDYSVNVLHRFAEEEYREIVNRLGYRYTLISSELPTSLTEGESVPFAIRLRNDGVAPMYNPRPVVLRICSGEEVVSEQTLGTDCRRWEPAETVTLFGNIDPDATIPEGGLRLSLWMPDGHDSLRDRPEFAVRFANVDVWDQRRGDNVLLGPTPPQPEPLSYPGGLPSAEE